MTCLPQLTVGVNHERFEKRAALNGGQSTRLLTHLIKDKLRAQGTGIVNI